MQKKLWIFVGCLFCLIGFIGVFLPLLPTTPFVLVAAFCFERGSPEFHQKLLDNKYLGPPLRDWQEHKRIKRKTKVFATTLIVVSSYWPLSNPNIPFVGKLSVGILLLGVILFITTRKES
jgi:uncharacterized membrane protein YbaN (DUF454 family)